MMKHVGRTLHADNTCPQAEPVVPAVPRVPAPPLVPAPPFVPACPPPVVPAPPLVPAPPVVPAVPAPPLVPAVPVVPAAPLLPAWPAAPVLPVVPPLPAFPVVPCVPPAPLVPLSELPQPIPTETNRGASQRALRRIMNGPPGWRKLRPGSDGPETARLIKGGGVDGPVGQKTRAETYVEPSSSPGVTSQRKKGDPTR